ncbi:M23 family metallopeptidase [Streptomyces sp. SL13]|uniref:M23 family metallopeptidase n=1 Tax=Streptantibioticus silvisoli TaxID=2705255 RepID=A0AA90JYI6_9ACTN|nr:M23 family metallopeptidase [Streptantibioticus silvisoli]MDI5971321.1 M23 family metallopeptidase [Streptantibioticus silvisoli]
MASNQSGSAVAEAIAPAMPPIASFDETTMMTWVPKQRPTVAAVVMDPADAAADPSHPGLAGPAFPDLPLTEPGFAEPGFPEAGVAGSVPARTPFAEPGFTEAAPAEPAFTDPGELLRLRIVNHVLQARAAVEREKAAVEAAGRAKEAAAQKVRDAAARKKAEEVARREAAELAAAEAASRAEEERLAALAASYVKPVVCCAVDGAGDFGAAGSPWAASNAGQDFAVPTGTPAVAVHSGTITAAGWAGSYGYRIVLTLDDGTQLWYCNLSSMVKTSGRVLTGDVIGRAGATGNASGPSLHLEVRPSGAAPVDPIGWLRDHGVTV